MKHWPLSLCAASVLVILVSGSISGCPRTAESPAASKPNFVFVVADTLRRDRLHYAGYDKPQSPNIDRLASESASFARAYATASWTLPSMASLFLSQPGFEHQLVIFGSSLNDEQTTLAEQLQAGGYETSGFTSNPLLDETSGFRERFENYEFLSYPDNDGMVLTESALDWLRSFEEKKEATGSEEPFFLYIHYMEPHLPYRCLPEEGVRCPRNAVGLTQRLFGGFWDFTPADREQIRELYDVEIGRLDRVIQALLKGLGELDLENTWFILTSDHGELLGEGDRYQHGVTLVEDLIHVPLLIRGPGLKPRSINVPVSLIDVAPTVLDLAGLEVPAQFRGRSLVGAMRGDTLSEIPVIAELHRPGEGAFGHWLNKFLEPTDRLAVINGDSKLVLAQDGTISAFDLAADAEERAPRPAGEEELRERLGSLEGRIDLEWKAGSAEPMDAETLRRLKVLGYVQ